MDPAASQPGHPRHLSLIADTRRSSALSIKSAVSSAVSDTNHQQSARPTQWVPLFLRPEVVGGITVLTLIYASVIQFLLASSQRYNGWKLDGLEQFGSVNLLKSVLPVIVVIPLILLYEFVDEALLLVQPYLVLSKGRARAKESVLLNYNSGRLYTFHHAILYKHWLVLFSSILTILSLVLSPMASGLLTTKPAEVRMYNYPVTNHKNVGLDSDLGTLEHFVAAAGYAQASAYHGLSNPPFVHHERWAIAEFVVPKQPSFGGNGSVIVPTTAVETECNCDQADSVETVLATVPGGNHTIYGKWYDCMMNVTIPDRPNDQYGVEWISECPSHAEQPPWFKPIAFWFFSYEMKQTAIVFCLPKLTLHNVLAEADLSSGLLKNVTAVNQNMFPNNISGAPMNGRAFNGIAFNLTDSNEYAHARAMAIKSGLPYAIYKTAKSDPGGLQAVMNDHDGFWRLTKRIYTRYLSVVAKSAYFVDADNIINSTLENYEIRIFVYPLVAHAMTAVLFIIAIMAISVHFFHARSRRDLYLSCDPGTIAGTISMTSHSRFTSLLDAGDSDKVIEEKLRGMKFGISKRTWQVAAYGEDEHAFGFGRAETTDASSYLGSPLPYSGKEKQFFNDPYGSSEGKFDESRRSLLSDTASTIAPSYRDSINGQLTPPSR